MIWATLFADDAGITLQSQSSLAKTVTTIVEACAAFDFFLSEKNTENNNMRPPNTKAEVVDVEAVGQTQTYNKIETFVRGGAINTVGDVSSKANHRTGNARKFFANSSKAA